MVVCPFLRFPCQPQPQLLTWPPTDSVWGEGGGGSAPTFPDAALTPPHSPKTEVCALCLWRAPGAGPQRMAASMPLKGL